MAINTSNKLLPILATVILLVVIGVIYVFTQTDLAKNINFMSMKPTRVKEVNVDADTAVDTLETIAVDSAEIRSKYKDVNESLAHQNKKLKQFTETIEQLNKTNAALMARLEEQDRKMEAIKDAGGTGTIDLDKIKEEVVASIKGKLPKLPGGDVLPGKDVDVDYTVGTVAGGSGQTGAANGTAGQSVPVEPPDTYSTLHSVNVPVGTDGKVPATYIKSLQADKDDKDKRSSNDKDATKDDGPVIDPRYTIFANSILNDAVAVTTLIGRIPRQGNVKDAAPFKIIIGRENLMANGFSVPGLDGMIMSGTVFGDANLECVRGQIFSATYIFEDGRGITFPKRKRKRQLGWISDEHGNPCIPGTYISNVKTQLKNRMMLAMAAGAADAFAKNEVTTLVNSNGGTSTAVTGNTSKFILGSAINNGSKQLTDFLDAQEFDVWDAVIVPSGHRVAVHLDTTLELDQTSLQRRAIYEQHTAHFGLTD